MIVNTTLPRTGHHYSVHCLHGAPLFNAPGQPSSTLPVFEAKVLAVAGEGWDSNVEQCCSCCVE